MTPAYNLRLATISEWNGKTGKATVNGTENHVVRLDEEHMCDIVLGHTHICFSQDNAVHIEFKVGNEIVFGFPKRNGEAARDAAWGSAKAYLRSAIELSNRPPVRTENQPDVRPAQTQDANSGQERRDDRRPQGQHRKNDSRPQGGAQRDQRGPRPDRRDQRPRNDAPRQGDNAPARLPNNVTQLKPVPAESAAPAADAPAAAREGDATAAN